MSQISLVMVAVGTALAALGTPLALVLSAIICGGGGAVSTPASSHLLARVSSPRYLPLVFSHQADGGAGGPAARRRCSGRS